MNIWVKRVVVTVVIVAFGFVLLNFDFFAAQVKYLFNAHIEPTGDGTPVFEEDINHTVQANRVRIPPLAIDAPIVYATENKESYFQEQLQKGVVHFPGTALPGQPGNVYIFGHSSDFAWSKGEYKTVFALLPKISFGERIYVSDDQAREYTYKVTSTKVVSPEQTNVLDQYNYEKKLLTLQTSYPIGTALKRFIVIAELVE